MTKKPCRAYSTLMAKDVRLLAAPFCHCSLGGGLILHLKEPMGLLDGLGLRLVSFRVPKP